MGVVTSGAPVLRLDAVVVGYTHRVVGPVSFALARDEVVGLTGPNGSGKTTLINAILGRARVFEGRVELAPGARVSVQRQHPVRLPEMPLSGREVLRLAGAVEGPIPEAIAPFVDRRIDRLSGGQYQLLQVWACLGARPDVAILDEPTSNMDPTSRASLIDILTARRGDGVAVLVISHHHDFLTRVVHRVVSIGHA